MRGKGKSEGRLRFIGVLFLPENESDREERARRSARIVCLSVCLSARDLVTTREFARCQCVPASA